MILYEVAIDCSREYSYVTDINRKCYVLVNEIKIECDF